MAIENKLQTSPCEEDRMPCITMQSTRIRKEIVSCVLNVAGYVAIADVTKRDKQQFFIS